MGNLVNNKFQRDVFQAIADPTRRQLLTLLAQAEREMSIAAIAKRFPISRTAINKHLQVLADARLVCARKIGRETRYILTPDPLNELQQWLSFFNRYWDNHLSHLKAIVESDDNI
ncbi:ArsR/SmtB family transcription factor [Alicyclobacillus acidiphilus]|uniref:ArsR/SmtB family transcription factor n=1 Tax=Alicyclobacillus acidiphilus TaxID=182455 RepID=UPI00082C9930|nr:metalloregulator ArsR/SmtB family transcription factor [Alicyclobacillus acidiphilus]